MTDDSPKTPVSVLICTKNEERNLGACLKSVAWADDCVVLDSYSDDQTVTIAREQGARVVQRQFDNFSTHKNWALDHLDFRHDWILIVDADERVTPESGPGDNGPWSTARPRITAIIWPGRTGLPAPGSGTAAGIPTGTCACCGGGGGAMKRGWSTSTSSWTGPRVI